ncbi:MAG TPA: GNAT family N-acetyltransferase [Gemmatimonadales bacterium]|nr:GNAT family N-acetyltransferase [Gemmatimonadales bacterium]
MSTPFARAARVWRRFQAHGLRVTLRGVMRRYGIRVADFHWVRERLPGEIPTHLTTLPDGLTFCLLDAEDISAITAFDAPQDEVDGDRLRQAFARGDVCVGIRRAGEILACSLCSLDETRNAMHPVAMKPNEAYLWMMYVRPGYRGQNLAVILRHRCYEMLRAVGRDTCYSITLTRNHASARFKQKLGAEKLFRAVYLRVGRREGRWIVRRFSA